MAGSGAGTSPPRGRTAASRRRVDARCTASSGRKFVPGPTGRPELTSGGGRRRSLPMECGRGPWTREGGARISGMGGARASPARRASWAQYLARECQAHMVASVCLMARWGYRPAPTHCYPAPVAKHGSSSHSRAREMAAPRMPASRAPIPLCESSWRAEARSRRIVRHTVGTSF